MNTITRTFPVALTNSYIPNSVIEVCHFRDMTFDADERVAVYLEAFFCNLNLKSFNLGIIPNFDGDESEAEKMAKFSAAEAKSQKVGLRILTRKNNTGDWQEKAEIILVNRGRKDYFDLLQPYLAKNQVRIFEKNDALAIQLIDYGNGLLTSTDSLGIEAAFTITIAKKNSLEAFEARLALLELAIKDRINNIPPNSLLGRDAGTGIVEVISQSKFATQANIDQAIIDLVGGAPGALNTLIELASALNNDANFAANITNLLGTKAPIANPIFTGFIGLGDNAKIKMKQLIGTTAASNTQGSNTASIPHNLTGDKISWFGVKISHGADAGIGDGFDNAFSGYSFDAYHDSQYVHVINNPSNSANILSKPLSILIIYTS